eukprot:532182-Alexandrium_andersonii.AAC.1
MTYPTPPGYCVFQWLPSIPLLAHPAYQCLLRLQLPPSIREVLDDTQTEYRSSRVAYRTDRTE